MLFLCKGYGIPHSAPDIRPQQNQSAHRQIGNPVNNTTDVTRIRSNDLGSMTRNAMHIAKLFSTKDRNHSGSDDDRHEEYIDQYIGVSRDTALTPGECQQVLHNFFAVNLYDSATQMSVEEYEIFLNLSG